MVQISQHTQSSVVNTKINSWTCTQGQGQHKPTTQTKRRWIDADSWDVDVRRLQYGHGHGRTRTRRSGGRHRRCCRLPTRMAIDADTVARGGSPGLDLTSPVCVRSH